MAAKSWFFRKIPKALQEIVSNTKKGTQGNSRELKGTQGNSREALVEEMEGKKLRKRCIEGKFRKSEKKKKKKRENIEALYERLKMPKK